MTTQRGWSGWALRGSKARRLVGFGGALGGASLARPHWRGFVPHAQNRPHQNPDLNMHSQKMPVDVGTPYICCLFNILVLIR